MYASLCSLWLRVYYMMKCCRDLHRIMWCKYTMWFTQKCRFIPDWCRAAFDHGRQSELYQTSVEEVWVRRVRYQRLTASPHTLLGWPHQRSPPPPTPPSLDNYLHHTPHFSSPLNFFNVVFFDVCLLYKRKLQTIVLLSKLLVNTEKSSSE